MSFPSLSITLKFELMLCLWIIFVFLGTLSYIINATHKERNKRPFKASKKIEKNNDDMIL